METDFSIGIVGGTGGIGRWFADFFTRTGLTVYPVGRRKGPPLDELASLCRVVIVAVPMASTAGVIAEIGQYLSPDSLLMDFTSLKGEPVRTMLAATSAEVVGCHPLFGPDVASLEGNNIILCPARGERWLSFFQGLFVSHGANVTLTSPEEHDRMMALIQGLTHFNTIMMELAVRNSGVEQSLLEQFSTPVFRTKRSLGAKLFGPGADLYAAIITKNPHIMGVIEQYEKNLSLLKGLADHGNTEGIARLLKG
jgi:prephenate dehydrogenase